MASVNSSTGGRTGKGNSTRNNDEAYTQWAIGQAQAAGVRNPGRYVRNNAITSAQGRTYSRNAVVNAIGRR